MDFSIDDLTIIALLLDEDEKKEKRRQHWVHPIWKFRDTEGEFATLYRLYTLEYRIGVGNSRPAEGK